jgi:hypothetical protein
MATGKNSIADSLATIIKHKYAEISDDDILICTVSVTYSDLLSEDQFGTMDVIDNKTNVLIPDIPLNAHINDDGTTGISGKYTFPKVGSDVYLRKDYDGAITRFIPILFSSIDSVHSVYNTERVTRVVEVDTPDPSKPYETTPTGKSTEVEQTQNHHYVDATDTSGSNTDAASHSVTPTRIDGYVDDGTDSTLVKQTATEFNVDTDSVDDVQTAVGAELLGAAQQELADIFSGSNTLQIVGTGYSSFPLVFTQMELSASVQSSLSSWASDFVTNVMIAKIKLK